MTKKRMGRADVHTAIVVAVSEELRAVLRMTRKKIRLRSADHQLWMGQLANRSVAVVRSGMGRQHAESAARTMLEHIAPEHALILGFCGGISEWAGPSDLVLAEYVMDWPDFPGESDTDQPDRTLHPDPSMLEAARRVDVPGVHVIEGGILSVGTLVRTTLMKGFHGPRAPRCRALDMETGPVAAVLEESQVPWVAVRAVTDTIDEDLPLPFEEFLGRGGDVDRTRVIGVVFAHPSLAPALIRLGRESLKAATNMAAFAKRFVAAT
jgi:adenosylhomocysteine nucleosidase